MTSSDSPCPGGYRCPGCQRCATTRRPLTARDEQRIRHALRNDPPIHGPRPLRLAQASDDITRYAAPIQCDKSYSCDCPHCQQQRSVLIANGHKHVRQPWQRAA